MKRLLNAFFVVFGTLGMLCTADAQLPAFGSFGDIPVEITADGETRFEGGVAIAENNVQIHFKDISIYCDSAEYNPDTRDVLLVGNVRIYQDKGVLAGERALYNLETKQIRSLEFAGEFYPLRFRALSLRAPSLNEFRLRDGEFTVDDSSEPSFRVRAKSVRIYPDSRVIFSRSTIYIGNVPVMWLPYLFAYTNNTGIEFLPGYYSSWGAYLLTSYTFPLTKDANILVRPRFDYRTERGVALGVDSIFRFGKADRSTGTFKLYYAWDQDPGDAVGGPGEPPEGDVSERYRISFQNRLYLTDDIYATFDINRLSDQDVMEDFFPTEFRVDPQPDTMISVTKWNEWYTLTLVTRWQMNDFQQTMERLPELSLDIKQHQLFGLPIYYDGTNSVGQLRQTFAEGDDLAEYQAVRFDTFHQISMQHTFFDFLSIVPKLGFRGVYYSASGQFVNEPTETFFAQSNATQLASQQNPFNVPTAYLNETGAIFRPIFNAGVESSMKFWKIYEGIQSRWLGLDGVLHVSQPYLNYSYVNTSGGPSVSETLQFDRLVPSTQLPSLNFPQFNTIDSIETWSILRLGWRHRLYTRRDGDSYKWFEVDNFVDANFDNFYSSNQISNFYTKMRFEPVPWFSLQFDGQMPATTTDGYKDQNANPSEPNSEPIDQAVDNSFTQLNTTVGFQPARSVYLQFQHRYLNGNPFFDDSNRLNASGFVRINDNWSVSATGEYAFEVSQVLFQQYSIHRDLSSWIMSLGFAVRNDVNFSTSEVEDTNYGVVFTMTLKDAPQVALPITFDQATSPLTGGSDN